MVMKSSALRLADPDHPARRQIDEIAGIVDRGIEVVLDGDRTATRCSFAIEDTTRVLSLFEEAIALCPGDADLRVAKASALHSFGQAELAMELLHDVSLDESDHFEANWWWIFEDTWSDAFRFPRWDGRASALHPVMAAGLALGHRVQIVRDGLQKTGAIVAEVKGPPLDSRTETMVAWVLSETPHGPIVAYYLKIVEPSEEPSTLEGFLPIFEPSLNTPMEGRFLVEQLAFTPSCFTVLVTGRDVVLNRRVVFGDSTAETLRAIADRVGTTSKFLRQADFQSAMQWHMAHFDIGRVTFD